VTPRREKGTEVPRERIHHGTQYVFTKSYNDHLPPSDVVGRPYRPGDDIPEGSTITEEPSFDVSWRKGDDGDGGWVQFSIDLPRDKWFEAIKELEADESVVSRAIYTETLTRDELNKAIRVLRRARDQAFGADE